MSRPRVPLATALALLAVVTCADAGLAWGRKGHELVCEIAFKELRPSAQAEVSRLIGLDPDYSTFAASCNWPDNPRKRASEHFLNVPRWYSYIGSPACRLANTCLFTAINNDVDDLTRSTVDSERLKALKFLGHWVGDIHQPLHVSFKDDRGGNEIHDDPAPPCSGSLHSVWDSCLVEKRVLVGGGVSATAQSLLATVSPDHRSRWINSTMVEWADESFRITISPATQYCELTNQFCQYDVDNRQLDRDEQERDFLVDDEYLNANAAAAREQLLKAGVRLGALLNEIFDPVDMEDP